MWLLRGHGDTAHHANNNCRFDADFLLSQGPGSCYCQYSLAAICCAAALQDRAATMLWTYCALPDCTIFRLHSEAPALSHSVPHLKLQKLLCHQLLQLLVASQPGVSQGVIPHKAPGLPYGDVGVCQQADTLAALSLQQHTLEEEAGELALLLERQVAFILPERDVTSMENTQHNQEMQTDTAQLLFEGLIDCICPCCHSWRSSRACCANATTPQQ